MKKITVKIYFKKLLFLTLRPSVVFVIKESEIEKINKMIQLGDLSFLRFFDKKGSTYINKSKIYMIEIKEVAKGDA